MLQRATNTTTPLSRWRSAGALGLAVLLVVLGLFGASPILHAELHHHGEHAGHHHHDQPLAHDDHGCAVLLYAQGVTTPAPSPHVQPPLAHAAELNFPTPAAPLLPARPHLSPPGRAPPGSRQSVTH